MKRIFTLAAFLLSIILTGSAQNLHIIQPGNPHILNDSTIYSYGLQSDLTFGPVLNVINSSSDSVIVNVRRVDIDTVTGSQNEICWALFCYGPSYSVSPNTEVIHAGDTAKGGNQFSGDYLPNGHAGASTIHYIFFDVHNSRDTAAITVVYDATPTSIALIKNGEISFSAPYPNPGRNNVTFNYSIANSVQSATLKVYNMLGECVQTLPLSAYKNKATIDVQSIPSGVYVCEVEAGNGQPMYQKLIVSH